MKKKEYIKPTIECISMKSQSILAGSAYGFEEEDDYTDADDFTSKETEWEDWESFSTKSWREQNLWNTKVWDEY